MKLLKTKFSCAGMIFLIALGTLLSSATIHALAPNSEKDKILGGIKKAVKFLDEKLSVNGGYVWTYSVDLKRRWGEMEAFPNIVWVQGPGTVAAGNLFLDLFLSTNDEYYFQLALKSAGALIKGQLDCGGWNYFINFEGESSTKKWYETIGRNGWRLEEFQHYYGNATFDDNSTTGAAMFLLRLYLASGDKTVYLSFKKAQNFILVSQSRHGGWPQRYPPTDKFEKNGNPDYTSCLTFNDGVTWNNSVFLINCYLLLGEESLKEPIERAINFFKITQQPKPQAGWAMQYTPNLKPSGARTYEPLALDPQYTARHLRALMKFYELTGDPKLLDRVPEGIDWLLSTRISGSDENSIIPTFVEIGTNKPIYLHRIGSNVKFGKYFYDYDSNELISHYNSTRMLNIAEIKKEYERMNKVKITRGSVEAFALIDPFKETEPLRKFEMLEDFFSLDEFQFLKNFKLSGNIVHQILDNMDEEGRWLTGDVFISNPYIGEPPAGDAETHEFVNTRVGDKYDTSPYQNQSEEKFISMSLYLRNVRSLISYLKEN